MVKETVLVINPGSTSTKLALFDREGPIYIKKLDHTGTPISSMNSIIDQLPLRLEIVSKTCRHWLEKYHLVAVVGRGGILRPLKSGIYYVSSAMMHDAITCKYATHASNLGASLVYEVSKEYNVLAYIIDPITVDEFIPEAYISGIPEIRRRSRLHALNINACVRKEAEKLGKDIKDTCFVAVHLGGGITVAAIEGGRIIDCNDALLGMGPFSPERAGALPLEGVLRLAMSGKYTMKGLFNKFSKNSGLKAYLGTNDVKEIIRRIDEGDEKADLIFRAMIYQTAKEIGAMATALKGKIDSVIVTGGMAYSSKVLDLIRERVAFIADVSVYPGENELEAMAAGGFRVIDGVEKINVYESE